MYLSYSAPYMAGNEVAFAYWPVRTGSVDLETHLALAAGASFNNQTGLIDITGRPRKLCPGLTDSRYHLAPEVQRDIVGCSGRVSAARDS